MTREEVMRDLRSGYVLIEGSRNDDAVNLAIVAYDDAGGNVESADQLNELARDLIDDEKIPVSPGSDFGYLEEKCEVLMNYLPSWYATGDIYSYAI